MADVAQWRLNSLKVVGVQLTNKTYVFLLWKAMSNNEHFLILWGQVPPMPPGYTTYDVANLQSSNHIIILKKLVSNIRSTVEYTMSQEAIFIWSYV